VWLFQHTEHSETKERKDIKYTSLLVSSLLVSTWCSKACISRFAISLSRCENMSIESCRSRSGCAASGRRRWWSRSTSIRPRRCPESPCTAVVSASSILADHRPRSIRDAPMPGVWWVMIIVTISSENKQFVLRPRILHSVLKLPEILHQIHHEMCERLQLSEKWLRVKSIVTHADG